MARDAVKLVRRQIPHVGWCGPPAAAQRWKQHRPAGTRSFASQKRTKRNDTISRFGSCLTTKPTHTTSDTYKTCPNADKEDRGRGKGKTVSVSIVFTIEPPIELIIESTIEPTI